MSARTVPKKNPPHVDLVPLMDTIFLLLFFFLCAAILQSGALPLNLAGQGEKIEKYHKITISAEEVTGLAEADSKIPVVIEAAPEVPFGKVDAVLRLLQEKGITKINFK